DPRDRTPVLGDLDGLAPLDVRQDARRVVAQLADGHLLHHASLAATVVRRTTPGARRDGTGMPAARRARGHDRTYGHGMVTTSRSTAVYAPAATGTVPEQRTASPARPEASPTPGAAGLAGVSAEHPA